MWFVDDLAKLTARGLLHIKGALLRPRAAKRRAAYHGFQLFAAWNSRPFVNALSRYVIRQDAQVFSMDDQLRPRPSVEKSR